MSSTCVFFVPRVLSHLKLLALDLPEKRIFSGYECAYECHVPYIESVSSLKWPLLSACVTWFIVVRLTMLVTSD